MFTTKQIRFSALCLGLVALAGGTGCQLFKKGEKKRDSWAIAADLEQEFKQRFMEKRVAELTARGTAPQAAQAQAEQEFRTRYPAVRAGAK